jgi:hypothetical protein
MVTVMVTVGKAIGNDNINWQLIVIKKCRFQSEIIEG